MGLLDEAIREHLDLKRRRGADPTEVERAEREALGPVRRGPEEPLAAAPADELLDVYDDSVPEHTDVDDGWDEPTSEHDAPVTPAEQPLEEYDDEYEVYHEPPVAAEPLAASESHESRSADPLPAPDELRFTSDQDELDDEPLPHVAPPDPAAVVRGDEHVPTPENSGETVEYDVERAIEAEHDEAKPEEDVLEETPEFLQDTPDHDRLWFEQRPPRDFDFDG
jgi:hypothetical protein